MALSNYDLQVQRAKALFLQWDSGQIARRFSLSRDRDFLYLPFFSAPLRICRAAGDIQELTPEGPVPCDFETHLSVFDALCRENGPAPLSGRWTTVNNLGRTGHPGVRESSLYLPYQAAFAGKAQALGQLLRDMGGRPFPVGDTAYQVDVFPFLPLVFQFWEADEEFPPQIQLLWDENTLDLIRYETAWYIAGHFLRRLEEKLGR